MNQVLLYAALLCSAALALFHRCPPREMTHPCTCRSDPVVRNVMVECSNVDIREALGSFRPYAIDSLSIKNVKMEKLNKGTFSKLTVHQLAIENSEIQFFDLFGGFDELHDNLEVLRLNSCDIKEWWWSSGRHFIHLESLIIENTFLADVLKKHVIQFIPSRSFANLEFINCGIKELENNALKSLVHIKNLNLAGNRLTFVKRNCLPRPAKYLSHYSLSGNPIKELADDMFLDMPRLEHLSLSNTTLRNLPLQVFNPVWIQLEEVLLNDNPLNCDCESAWFLSEEIPPIFQEPVCQSPPEIKGKKVTTLKREQLCSFEEEI